MNGSAFILGCGYLGLRLLERLRARGQRVQVTVRSARRAGSLARMGVSVQLLDVTAADAGQCLQSLVASERPGGYDLYYLVPPSRGPGAEQVLIEGAQRVTAALARVPPRRAVVASSTAVYGDLGGAVVQAETPARPADARGRLLLAGETCWTHSGLPVQVVRLAGLYGPGRVIGQRALLAGEPIGGDPAHWLNLVEISDAAALLEAVATAAAPAAVELGADGSPVRRREYYTWLAGVLGAPAPRFEPAGATAAFRAGDRRCDSRTTAARTGWTPRFADFRAGLTAALAAQAD